MTKKQTTRTSIQNFTAFFQKNLKFWVNEELYNDKIHNILDILADEELYLLNIRFITNLQNFPSQSNHFSQSWSNYVYSSIYFPYGKSSQHVSRRSYKWSISRITTQKPSEPNYSIHCSRKDCNLDCLAATYLNASTPAHYHPGTQVCSSLCMYTRVIVLEYVMVSTPRGWFGGGNPRSRSFSRVLAPCWKRFHRGK